MTIGNHFELEKTWTFSKIINSIIDDLSSNAARVSVQMLNALAKRQFTAPLQPMKFR